MWSSVGLGDGGVCGHQVEMCACAFRGACRCLEVGTQSGCG